MPKDPLRIAISGLSGCGNTTVSRLLGEELSLNCLNYTFRNLAKDKGISFEEMRLLAEADDHWDKFLDHHQVDLAMKGSCILASRLAIWLLREGDAKIYLEASPEVRFARIAQREGIDLREALEKTSQRDAQDVKRYKRLYDIDVLDLRSADLIINTDILSPAEIVAKIVEYLRSKNLI